MFDNQPQKVQFTFARDIANGPSRAGEIAFRKIMWDGNRYAVAPVHTRFDAVEWFVWGAEKTGFMGDTPEIIRQSTTLPEAIDGLVDNFKINLI